MVKRSGKGRKKKDSLTSDQRRFNQSMKSLITVTNWRLEQVAKEESEKADAKIASEIHELKKIVRKKSKSK